MVPAQIKLWELAGDKPDCKISPYAWRVRLTLALKGLQYESIPWRFTDKDAIKPFEKVPVLEYNGKRFGQSLDICKFLDQEVPEPALFRTNCHTGDVGMKFVVEWSNTTMFQAIAPVLMLDIWNHLAPEDKQYFRTSRETRFGSTLEDSSNEDDLHQRCTWKQHTKAQVILDGVQLSCNVHEKIEAFQIALEPLRQTLQHFRWLGGNRVSYADISVASQFLWCRAVSKTQLLERDDPVYEWRENVFKEFHETISNSFGYPV